MKKGRVALDRVSLDQCVRRLIKRYSVITSVVRDIGTVGGRALLVGGAVRDLLMEQVPHDLDIEVYKITQSQLQKILRTYGNVSLVGKSFGVLRIHGIPIDWSLPRADSAGRKPAVRIDPSMTVRQACARRDLTINAIGIDLVTGELVDPFGGLADIRSKTLRTPSVKKFVQDPLRFYRVMQFIGRFNMTPDKQLNNLCAHMDISGVSRERIEQEFNKLFLKSRYPSCGIDWLARIGRLGEVMPELAALKGVRQSVKWHPEGDVYVHTLQVLDASAATKKIDDRERLIFAWAAICHDLGKVSKSVAHSDGHISAHGHEEAGVPLAKKLLRRFTRDKNLVDSVCILTRYHMDPRNFIEQHAKAPAYKRLALRCEPVSLRLLALFACADLRGRNSKSNRPLPACVCVQEKLFMQRAKKLAVFEQTEKPVLQGKDLLGLIEPGPIMGKLLRKAYALQIDEGIVDKEKLKKRVLLDS